MRLIQERHRDVPKKEKKPPIPPEAFLLNAYTLT